MPISVSKNSICRLLVFGSIFALLLICSACLLTSNFPLSNSNNFHEAKLEGTWLCEKEKDGKKQTETIVISDSGPKYISKSLEDNKIMTFILTKLESYYFISVQTKDRDWWIFRIQFEDNKLLVLGLNEKGLKLSEKITEQRNKKTYIKISQRELQQWCVKNAKLFTYKLYCYERGKNSHNTSVARTESVAQFAGEFCTVMMNADKGFSENNPSTASIKAYGEKLKSASAEMFSMISKAKIPTDVRDAALDLAQNYDKMANLLINAPYIPRDFAEGFLIGFLKGAAGDHTGGYGEISDWQEKIKQTMNDYNDKKQKFIVVLIKNGVEM